VGKLLLALAVAGAAWQAPVRTNSTQMTDQIRSTVEAFRGTMGVAAKNLGTGEEVLVNADLRFPTASTIKTAVMVEAYHRPSESWRSTRRSRCARPTRSAGRACSTGCARASR
jgi:beta-lactamase class A